MEPHIIHGREEESTEKINAENEGKYLDKFGATHFI